MLVVLDWIPVRSNPATREPRLIWPMNIDHAQDSLQMASLIYRRLEAGIRATWLLGAAE